jgi:eukaryotic-like serine/threonine-protein kinase
MATCPDNSILRAFADGDTTLAVDEELMRHIESCEKCQAELDDLTALGPVHVPPAVAIPGFEIHRVLGKGGMGHVFEATEEATGRQVALKVLPAASLPSAEAQDRFRAEAGYLMQLDHPGIVTVYDSGEAQDGLWISMQFVEGESLASKLKEQLDERTIAQWMRSVAQAVQAAHGRFVLHRDVKPSNIVLTPEGTLVLIDFGIARRVDLDSELTGTGTGITIGTPLFMAPEQAFQQSSDAGIKTTPDDLDVRCDVWGIGATMYACLTGRPPRGPRYEAALRELVERRPIPGFRLAAPDRRISVDLETICLKCLETERGDRYSSAGEVADDLKRWLNNEPILASPPGIMKRTRLWCRRNRAMTVGLVSFGVVLVLLAAGFLAAQRAGVAQTHLRQQADDERDKAQEARDHAEKQQQIAEEQSLAAGQARVAVSVRRGSCGVFYGAGADFSVRSQSGWIGGPQSCLVGGRPTVAQQDRA